MTPTNTCTYRSVPDQNLFISYTRISWSYFTIINATICVWTLRRLILNTYCRFCSNGCAFMSNLGLISEAWHTTATMAILYWSPPLDAKFPHCCMFLVGLLSLLQISRLVLCQRFNVARCIAAFFSRSDNRIFDTQV